MSYAKISRSLRIDQVRCLLQAASAAGTTAVAAVCPSHSGCSPSSCLPQLQMPNHTSLSLFVGGGFCHQHRWMSSTGPSTPAGEVQKKTAVEGAAPAAGATGDGATSTSGSSASGTSAEVEPQEEWTEVFHQESGQTYYWNQRTGMCGLCVGGRGRDRADMRGITHAKHVAKGTKKAEGRVTQALH